MINKYEQAKTAAYIKMLEGTLEYWRNELARIESEPVLLTPSKPTPEEISKFKKALDEAMPPGQKYPIGGIVCPNPEHSETSNDGVNWTPAKRGVKAKPVVTHIEETGPIDPGAFDKLKSMKNAKPNGPTKLSISSLWELFKARHKLKDPLDSGHAIVFAKYIRELTIDETVSYMHAEPEPPGSTAGDWTASAFLICRPDKDNINLPKDYQI